MNGDHDALAATRAKSDAVSAHAGQDAETNAVNRTRKDRSLKLEAC